MRLDKFRLDFDLRKVWAGNVWIHHPEPLLSTGNTPQDDAETWICSMVESRCIEAVDTTTGSNVMLILLRNGHRNPAPVLVKAIHGLLDKGVEIDHEDRK